MRLAYPFACRPAKTSQPGQFAPTTLLTPPAAASTVEVAPMTVPKIQIGQLWKKNDNGDIYLVTRVYSEALSTMVVLRKSGSESDPLVRV